MINAQPNPIGRGLCDPSPAPDLLNQLHTLRSLAHDVKRQCDEQKLWQISAVIATVAEEATICIEKLNGSPSSK